MLKSTSAALAVALLWAAGCASTTRTETAGTTTTTLPTPSGQPVVITQPGPSAAVRGEVRHQVTGRVTEIERNASEVTIRTPDGSKVTLKLPPMAVATVREGDTVNLDVTIVPR